MWFIMGFMLGGCFGFILFALFWKRVPARQETSERLYEWMDN
jgi:hypothetical protein